MNQNGKAINLWKYNHFLNGSCLRLDRGEKIKFVAYFLQELI